MKFKGVDVTGFSFDTRIIQPGECFVAIKTKTADGHDYLAQAKTGGASMALVERVDPSVDMVQVQVENTIDELSACAKEYRQLNHQAKLVALTGSCGKTTTRELLSSILSLAGSTHASQKSYNNYLGVPLTLLAITHEHEYVVQEMGANHPNELAALTQVAKPDVAMITNAAPVHLDGFKSVSGVARAKAEIFQGLGAHGVAVINRDDTFYDYWRSCLINRKVISFGLHDQATVRATDIVLNDQGQPSFTLHIGDYSIGVALTLLGQYNVMNALAASACAHALGIAIDLIAEGLTKASGVDRRMRLRHSKSGAQVLDDSYNANPKAVMAAIDVLGAIEARTILVLGNMGELGREEKEYHREVGLYAKHCGVDQLLTLGDLACNASTSFGEGGMHFDSKKALVRVLSHDISDGVTVLVKGSNSMGMDDIVKEIL